MARITLEEVQKRLITSATNSSHGVWLYSDLHFFQTENDWIFAYQLSFGTHVFALEPLVPSTAMPLNWTEQAVNFSKAWQEILEQLQPRCCQFVGIGEAFIQLLHPLGFQSIKVGSEPWIHVENYKPSGNAARGVRSAKNFALRSGVWIEEHDEKHLSENPGLLSDLNQIYKIWTESSAVHLEGFMLATKIYEPLAHKRLCFVAKSKSRIEGFLNATYISGTHSYYLEDVITLPDSPKGSSELLILFAIEFMKKQQIHEVSLGVVSLVNVENESHSPPPGVFRRTMKILLYTLGLFYNGGGIEVFRKRFQPTRWSGIYISVKNIRRSTRSQDWFRACVAIVMSHKPSLSVNFHSLSRSIILGIKKRPLLYSYIGISILSFGFANHFGTLSPHILKAFGFTASAPWYQWLGRSLLSDFLFFDPFHFASIGLAAIFLLWDLERHFPKRFLCAYVLLSALVDDFVNHLLLIRPWAFFQPTRYEPLRLEYNVGPSLIVMGLIPFWLKQRKKVADLYFGLISLALFLGLVFSSRRYSNFIFNADHMIALFLGVIVMWFYRRWESAQSRKIAQLKTPEMQENDLKKEA